MSDELHEQQIQALKEHIEFMENEMSAYRQEVSRLNEHLEKLIQQIGNQLEVANSIQRVLVPTEIPTIPGFDFSNKFVASGKSGGDYYDIFELEDRFRFAIVLSHASGHALSGLLLSLLLKLMAESEARRGSGPDRMLELLGKELRPNMKETDEISFFYGIVDRRTLDLQYVLLGDVKVFAWIHSSKEVKNLDATGTALASKSHWQPARTINLNSRDRLILVSPGVMKTKNPQGEEFGVDRIIQVIKSQNELSTHELRNELLFQAQFFRAPSSTRASQTETWDQDVTVLVADVKDRVLKLAKR